MKKMKTIISVILCLCMVGIGKVHAQDTLRNLETQHFFNSLKAFTKSDFTMFGMANALTISYSGGPRHAFTDKSDAKDITGSHPAMIESDFMWYENDPSFLKQDTTAMREAYKRGAVVGYCYHLRGRLSNDFYAKSNNKFTRDSFLVKNILASANRDSNLSLDWYLDILDKKVIPIFKGLGFPIIYRPFHEMTGNWFWWGTATCTPAELIQIYKLTVDYLRKAGVKNVLYAWAPDKSADFKFYPGDDYIDVIGYDGYDVGAVDYHSTSLFVSYTGKLSDYARTHDKVFAVTETGHGKYPATHPDYWLDHILKPMKKNAKARYAAWIMTWYNADWSNNGSGTSWIPYLGIEDKTNGQTSIDQFLKFYNDPRTIFLNDMPNLYYNQETSAFILPKSLSLVANDSLRLLGGSKNNWFNDVSTWASSDPTIATVDSKGLVKCLKGGKVNIIVTTPDGTSSDTCKLEVIALASSVQTNDGDNVKIYPSPSSGNNINFDFGEISGMKKVLIYNVEGKKLYSFSTLNNMYALNDQNLEPGYYFAKINNGVQNINKGFWVK